MEGHVIELSCNAIGASELLRLRGAEAMNALPRWEVEVLLQGSPPDPQALIGEPAALRLFDEMEGAERIVELVIVEAACEGDERAGVRCSLSLSALACVCAERSGYRVSLDRAAHEIVQTVLKDAGVPEKHVELRLAAQYFQRPQCTQHDETDWAFIERLLAEEGISCWFDDSDAGTRLVLGDDMASHDGIPAPLAVPFGDGGGLLRRRSFSSLERTDEVAPDAVFLRDFDVRNPDVPIDGAAGDGPLTWFEYPSFCPAAAAAKGRATARLSQLRRHAVVLRGETDCSRVRPGRLLDIEGVGDEACDGRHLVIAVEHSYARPAPHDAHARPYTNVVTLVPASGEAYRPAAPSSRPRVEHVDSAVITGPAGEEIHTDSLGQTKLRFFWDPSGITDDRSSAWARTLQWSLTGSMMIPRVGWEVPVMYMDGSPDRPVVLGRAYNGQRVVPYALPGARAVSTLQSATTPFDGTVNEIRMTDSGGAQEMRIQASRDQSVLVGGAAKTTVAADETHDIGLALAQVVNGSQSRAVGGAETVSVARDARAQIGGDDILQVGGMQSIGAGANAGVMSKGFYGEFIGAAYLLQCNQSNTRVTGGYFQINGGALAVSAGMGTGESVAGARADIVGGAYTVTAGGTFKDGVTGPKAIQAGACSESAGGSATTKAPRGAITAGTATVTAGGAIVVEADSITISASSVSIGSLTLGGSMSLSGGSLSIKASSINYFSGGSVGA